MQLLIIHGAVELKKLPYPSIYYGKYVLLYFILRKRSFQSVFWNAVFCATAVISDCPDSLIYLQSETFAKRSILFKSKKGENFNHRNTLSILRIKI